MLLLIFFIFVILIAAFLLENHRELNTFRVKEYQVASPKLNALEREVKIVVLADLHNKVYGEKNDILVQAIKQQNPDLIFVAGDMLIGKSGKSERSFEPAVEFMEQIASICPVYYGNGNHEQRMKEDTKKYGNAYSRYKKCLERKGIIFLENASVKKSVCGVDMEIHGLEIPMVYYEKFQRRKLAEDIVKQCLGKADTSRFQILIAHNPVFFPAYKAWGADLSVSGHLHGGIIRIPGIGALISPQAVLFPKYSGEMVCEDGAYQVTSKGLGTHTVNIRLFNQAEIVVLHLI